MEARPLSKPVDPVLSRLKSHRDSGAVSSLRAAFQSDPDRARRFTIGLDDLRMDFSKCAITEETLALLGELATAAAVEANRDRMLAGEAINSTEDRAVLHTALRAAPDAVIRVDGENIVPGVHAVLGAMGAFSDGIRDGAIRGATGKAFTDVVNIGIGGSDLGPVMATLALAPCHDGPRLHFVSNVDGAHIADTLSGLDPERTLIIVASKTFTTIETMTNAATARDFIVSRLGEEAVASHFAAVSTALDKVGKFGLDETRVFGFWDWVGGRYSLWSAIGLPLMIAIGREAFGEFLAGARAMDEHFKTAPVTENLPMMLGLLGIWHRLVCGYPSRAIIPYEQRLSRFPAYLQQLDMESNGKSVGIDGEPLSTATGPVVWGEPGTNGQHAFFQLLHQGTDVIPVEFIIAANGHEPELAHQHQLLIANCLAQSEALMRGRSTDEARAQLLAGGASEAEADRLAPHKTFPGNRPSITLVHDKLTPFSLGRLIALYEHRVFVEAQIFGINAFDQWGVELGKELATALLPVVKGESQGGDHDSSTLMLANIIRGMRRTD
ncbi:MAG: glucose-6-phosphate isomerase [Hoeflea sp.]|uniref:glucose-6-phosphate isomerase n=1 Tax=Hoeflea sp. TaxID=1940281 RepID=UPI001D25122E|nr:glucose-6-phosphate isomerase [Hoeflea sp.]MBU4531274.1 glucose-6-phosphate isomerase [Alphaproteobacteria bacterium]MBU4545663.1 glucose-6-phosphate isomerase [Alphaproteobacteria bacterium]MBU4550632.1 glucose-6-phosphate isomerase [Alphaproteobacteria bacterium]MBV1724551.1 glucose-6-phosphate isomerase [Hoeflea sp.]MBV1760571.1 glucose-6-phosphate isomerase [Hoeflea sp.]